MRPVAAHRVFFPAAATHGAVAIGLWALPPEPVVPATWHVHELVFGYAMAVVAGFLLTKASGREVLAALAIWLLARLAWLVPDTPDALRAVLTVAATAGIVGLATRGLLRGIKRGQNATFPVLLPALALCDAASQAGLLLGWHGLARHAAETGLLLVVLLILVMGGRIAGAALSGLAQRASGARIPPQPRAEPLLAAALALAAVATALDAPLLLAASAWTAAAVIGLRIAGWRAALPIAGADLWALVASQAFMAVGFAGMGIGGMGIGTWQAPWPATAPLHLVAIGGIGIATAVMMLKTHAQRDRRPLPGGLIAAAALLLAAAAVVRAAGYAAPDLAYPLAGAVWMAAMAVCLAGMLRRGPR